MAVGEPILNIVNRTMLDAGLTQIANAIRAKGGTSAQLAFPDGMAAAIAAIEAGGGGGINATAGTITVATDTNDYVITHGLGETPKFFAIGMNSDASNLTGKNYILIGAFGFSDYAIQYRISLNSSGSTVSGICKGVPITINSSSRQSISEANENTIEVASYTGSQKLVSGTTYYWVAIGSGVFE